jgi:TonB-linked SusC/RagA family outer membrane protein
LQNTNRLTYNFNNGGNHRFQVDAVHEAQFSKNVFMNTDAEGFFSDGTTYKDMALGQIQLIDNGETSSSLQSVLGRVNYSFADKYLFTASIRADGSSKFREGNKWGYFPSGSAAWRMTQEGFMQDVKTISNLKIRASYGITGSQAIAPLATRSRPVIGVANNYPYTGDVATVGAAPSNRMANPNLTWEQTAQSDIGIDLGLWDNKLTIAFDMYKKITSDLLLDRNLPEFVGPTVVAQNIGKMENRGLEFALGFSALQTDDWSISGTVTFNRNINEVLELVDDKPIEQSTSNFLGQYLPVQPTRLEIGKPMSNFRGYIFEGVYQTGDEAAAALFNKKPGDAIYADISGPEGVPDGIITTDDITSVGDASPDFTIGWNGNVSWKNLSLDYLFVGSVGNDIYNFQRARMMSLGAATFHASHADYKNRWTVDNPSNTIPSGRDGTEALSSAFVEDGSYFTLKNLSLAYVFNNVAAFRAIGLDALKIYGSVENAFIVTNYTGFDPESTATGNSDVEEGIDLNAYPLSRTFILGIKFTF